MQVDLQCSNRSVSREFCFHSHFHPLFSSQEQILAHNLNESEVFSLVLYTYDIMAMGPQQENFFFQLNDILRRRSVC